jgi:hypothetical protein
MGSQLTILFFFSGGLASAANLIIAMIVGDSIMGRTASWYVYLFIYLSIHLFIYVYIYYMILYYIILYYTISYFNFILI